MVSTRTDFGRVKRQLLRPLGIAVDFSLSNRSGSPDRGQVLGLEAWFGTLRADVVEMERFASDQRKAQRGAQYLPAAFSHGSIDLDPITHI